MGYNSAAPDVPAALNNAHLLNMHARERERKRKKKKDTEKPRARVLE